MGKRAQSLLAMCPFYKSEDKHCIVCEGLLPRSSIHVAFGAPADKRAFEKDFCKSWHYDACELAQMHRKRYEKAED